MQRKKEKESLVLEKERQLVEAEKLKSTTIRATTVDTRVEDLSKGIEEQSKVNKKEQEVANLQLEYNRQLDRHKRVKEDVLSKIGDPLNNPEINDEFDKL